MSSAFVPSPCSPMTWIAPSASLDAGVDDDALARLEAAHAVAERLDDAGAVGAEDARLRHRRQALPDPHVEVVQRRRAQPHEHLARGRRRIGGLFEDEDLGAAVLVDANRLHEAADYRCDGRASSPAGRRARHRRRRLRTRGAVRGDRAAHPRAAGPRPLRRHALHDGAAGGVVPPGAASRRRADGRLRGALLLRRRAGAAGRRTAACRATRGTTRTPSCARSSTRSAASSAARTACSSTRTSTSTARRAARSGVGFYGKNTLLITQRHGSWVVLGTLVTDVELEPTPPLDLDCGACRLCIDACPTGALDEPGTLDATRCLSYWTQAAAPIPEGYRADLGAQVYGCDICQDVCPWNRGVEKRRPDAPAGRGGAARLARRLAARRRRRPAPAVRAAVRAAERRPLAPPERARRRRERRRGGGARRWWRSICRMPMSSFANTPRGRWTGWRSALVPRRAGQWFVLLRAGGRRRRDRRRRAHRLPVRLPAVGMGRRRVLRRVDGDLGGARPGRARPRRAAARARRSRSASTAIVAIGFVAVFSYQSGEPYRALYLIPIAEAALRFGLVGGPRRRVVMVGATIVVDAARARESRGRPSRRAHPRRRPAPASSSAGCATASRRARTAEARAAEAERLRDELGRRGDILEAANRCARALGSSLEIETAFGAFIRELRGLVAVRPHGDRAHRGRHGDDDRDRRPRRDRGLPAGQHGAGARLGARPRARRRRRSSGGDLDGRRSSRRTSSSPRSASAARSSRRCSSARGRSG